MIIAPMRTLLMQALIIVTATTLFSSCTKTDQQQQSTDDTSCPLDSLMTIRTKNNIVTNLQKTLYTYDEKGRWVKIHYYYEGKSGDRQEITYAGDDKISMLTLFDAENRKYQERKVFYDQQGRVGGFDQTSFDPYINPVKKVTFVYEENKMTVVGWSGADTLFKTIRFYENGNEVRAERWNNNILQGIDSTSYTSQLHKHKFNEDLTLVQSTMTIHKNLIARRKMFDNVQKVYQQDDNFSYEFTSGGMVKKVTSITNFPISNKAPIESYYFYRCD